MRLADCFEGRNNNFNLIRLCAAWMVLMSHSHVIVTGDPRSEPLAAWLNMTPGSIAVDIFFISSGLLVTASLMRRPGLREFVMARVARIYPAMVVMTLASIAVFGLFFTAMPLGEYLADERTRIYLLKNTTIVGGVTGALPGVLLDVPFRGVVNASLWTLKFEVHMYLTLAAIGLCGLAFARQRDRFVALACLSVAVLAYGLHTKVQWLEGVVDQRFRLFALFFIGSGLYFLRGRIVLSGWGALASVVLLVFTFASLPNRHVFEAAYPLASAYLILCAAYLPRGRVLQFNRLGDYSYGLYIYAFPVQQLVIQLMPGMSIFMHVVVSTVVTLGFAVPSWHLLEKPVLSRSKRGLATTAVPAA